MKTFHALLFSALLSFLFVIPAVAQPNISSEQIIKKGNVVLKDGTSLYYKNLQMKTTDTITFVNSAGAIEERSVAEIYKITKTGNYAAYGAVSGGVGALLGALSAVVNTDPYVGGDTSGSGGLVVGITLGGAAFGALVGAVIKREKTLYKASSLTFTPTIFNQNQIGFNVGASFNISKK